MSRYDFKRTIRQGDALLLMVIDDNFFNQLSLHIPTEVENNNMMTLVPGNTGNNHQLQILESDNLPELRNAVEFRKFNHLIQKPAINSQFVFRVNTDYVPLRHNEHPMIKIPTGTWEVRRQIETIDFGDPAIQVVQRYVED